jgi:transposase-like protein
LIDATPFEGQQMIVALGIGHDGSKTILGIRQGATENATVVGELLGDLMQRGFDFSQPRLYVLDGGKALHAAVKSMPAKRRQSNAARCTSDAMCWITSPTKKSPRWPEN